MAMVLAVGFALPWILTRLVEYSHDLIANIPKDPRFMQEGLCSANASVLGNGCGYQNPIGMRLAAKLSF